MCANRIFLIFFFSWIISVEKEAMAQPDSTSVLRNNRTLALYSTIPAFAVSTSSALNGILLETGYPRIPKGNVNWGLGGQYRWTRLFLGVEMLGSYQTRQREDTNSQLTRLALTTNIITGFYLYQKSSFAVFPFVGLSATGASLYLSKPTASVSVNTLLASPGNTVKLTHFSGGLVFGLGIDLQNADRPNSVFESLRIGYRMSPDGAHPWESRFTQMSNAPADRFNYWFFQLNLGTAWHWRKGTLEF